MSAWFSGTFENLGQNARCSAFAARPQGHAASLSCLPALLGWGHPGLLAIPATQQGTPNPRAFALTILSPGSTLPQAPSWAGPLTSFRGGLS